jgi:hypothetical protein
MVLEHRSRTPTHRERGDHRGLPVHGPSHTRAGTLSHDGVGPQLGLGAVRARGRPHLNRASNSSKGARAGGTIASSRGQWRLESNHNARRRRAPERVVGCVIFRSTYSSNASESRRPRFRFARERRTEVGLQGSLTPSSMPGRRGARTGGNLINRKVRRSSRGDGRGGCRVTLGAVVVLGATLALLLAAGVPTLALTKANGSRRSDWWVRPNYRCTGVNVRRGANIQAKIDAHPEGTTFCIHEGVYRLVAPLTPKNGDRFIGQGRAVLSGAQVLSSFTRSGSYWLATGQTQESTPAGVCVDGYTGCQYNEDVYIDNVPLRQVTSQSELGPGRFYFDYGADTIYLADDPAGHRVEATIATRTFLRGPRRVQVKGLRIEKFSNPAQDSCAGGSRSGLFAGNEVRFCHGIGVGAYDYEVVKNNWIHHMGEMGVSAPLSTGAVFENNEIAHNNTMGFDPSWEGGGSKFTSTTHLTVTGNYVHHNVGGGLWTDIDNIHTLYARNIVERNSSDGIVHEISYEAVIRNNIIRRNGDPAPGVGWGAGILVAASPDVTIRGNLLTGNKAGILLLAQDRGSGAHGLHILMNNYVHHNTVRMPRTNGLLLDGVSDLSYYESRGNRFQYNTYYLRSNPTPFYWMNAYVGRKRWVGYGQDTKGTFIRS